MTRGVHCYKMATQKQNQDLGVTSTFGSEEIFDFFCEPCSAEKHVEAEGYCQQCREYLCSTCCYYHGKFSAFKHHKVLDKTSMPKTKPPKQDVLTTTCEDHPGKILEYFCEDHDMICCSVCLTLGHSSCSSKSYIPDISDGIENNQEQTTCIEELNDLVIEVTRQLTSINDNVHNNDLCRDSALTNIDEFRTGVNKVIDEMEQETRERLTRLHTTNLELTTKQIDDCRMLLREVKSMLTEIQANSKANNKNQLFVGQKLSKQRMNEIRQQLKEIKVNEVQHFAFTPGTNLKQGQSALSALWCMSVRIGTTPTTAQYVRQVSVMTDEDTDECLVSGMAVLDPERLVVTDFNNKSVKLIDSDKDRVVSRLKVCSKPFDVVKLSQTQVAIALGTANKIELINVASRLTSNTIIPTPGAKVAGLSYDGSNFIASCYHPGSVKIFDMSGTTLRTFTTDSHGTPLFTSPCYIAAGRAKDVIYLTDKDANTLTCMTTTGDVLWVYTHDELKRPCGVAVGKDGSVYICSRDSRCVHQVCATGSLERIILSQDQGLRSGPGVVSYHECFLYISSQSTAPDDYNYIRLYRLQ